MTIEERLVKDLGTTDVYELAVWMLKDGTLVNGSYEGYQRDVDHHTIISYYKRSKREDLGSCELYIRKFENRGNIRMGCSSAGFVMQLSKPPTQKQLEMMMQIAVFAAKNHIECGVGIRKGMHAGYMSWSRYMDYLARYGKQPYFDRKYLDGLYDKTYCSDVW